MRVHGDGHLLGATSMVGSPDCDQGFRSGSVTAPGPGYRLHPHSAAGVRSSPGTEEHSPLKELQGPQRAYTGDLGHRNPHLGPNRATEHFGPVWDSTSVPSTGCILGRRKGTGWRTGLDGFHTWRGTLQCPFPEGDRQKQGLECPQSPSRAGSGQVSLWPV